MNQASSIFILEDTARLNQTSSTCTVAGSNFANGSQCSDNSNCLSANCLAQNPPGCGTCFGAGTYTSACVSDSDCFSGTCTS